MTDQLSQLLVRELNHLKKEIESYESEVLMWKILPGTTNSGGNLCLHLVGNLKHFIGAVLGNDGYIRDRAAEFNNKDVPALQLLSSIDETINVIEKVLTSLTEEQLKEDFPIVVFKEVTKTGHFLMHLLAHLNYHLGQINYHRRIVNT